MEVIMVFSFDSRNFAKSWLFFTLSLLLDPWHPVELQSSIWINPIEYDPVFKLNLWYFLTGKHTKQQYFLSYS